MFPKHNTCLICEKPISNSEELCELCKAQLTVFKKDFTCNCDEDDQMLLCRDCILNSDRKEKWRKYLLIEEINA